MKSRMLAVAAAAFCLTAAGAAKSAIVFEQTGSGDTDVFSGLPAPYAGDWRATIVSTGPVGMSILADWFVTWSYFEWSTQTGFFGNDYFLGDSASGGGTALELSFTVTEDLLQGPFVDDGISMPYGYASGTPIGYLETVTGGYVSFGVYGADPDTTWTLRLERVDVSAAPEPGVWLLMILGFGATGAALRRRAASIAV